MKLINELTTLSDILAGWFECITILDPFQRKNITHEYLAQYDETEVSKEFLAKKLSRFYRKSEKTYDDCLENLIIMSETTLSEDYKAYFEPSYRLQEAYSFLRNFNVILNIINNYSEINEPETINLSLVFGNLPCFFVVLKDITPLIKEDINDKLNEKQDPSLSNVQYMIDNYFLMIRWARSMMLHDDVSTMVLKCHDLIMWLETNHVATWHELYGSDYLDYLCKVKENLLLVQLSNMMLLPDSAINLLIIELYKLSTKWYKNQYHNDIEILSLEKEISFLDKLTNLKDISSDSSNWAKMTTSVCALNHFAHKATLTTEEYKKILEHNLKWISFFKQSDHKNILNASLCQFWTNVNKQFIQKHTKKITLLPTNADHIWLNQMTFRNWFALATLTNPFLRAFRLNHFKKTNPYFLVEHDEYLALFATTVQTYLEKSSCYTAEDSMRNLIFMGEIVFNETPVLLKEKDRLVAEKLCKNMLFLFQSTGKTSWIELYGNYRQIFQCFYDHTTFLLNKPSTSQELIKTAIAVNIVMFEWCLKMHFYTEAKIALEHLKKLGCPYENINQYKIQLTSIDPFIGEGLIELYLLVCVWEEHCNTYSPKERQLSEIHLLDEIKKSKENISFEEIKNIILLLKKMSRKEALSQETKDEINSTIQACINFIKTSNQDSVILAFLECLENVKENFSQKPLLVPSKKKSPPQKKPPIQLPKSKKKPPTAIVAEPNIDLSAEDIKKQIEDEIKTEKEQEKEQEQKKREARAKKRKEKRQEKHQSLLNKRNIEEEKEKEEEPKKAALSTLKTTPQPKTVATKKDEKLVSMQSVTKDPIPNVWEIRTQEKLKQKEIEKEKIETSRTLPLSKDKLESLWNDLPPAIRTMITTSVGTNRQVFAVGGYVRDKLLSLPFNDIDLICFGWTEEELKKTFHDLIEVEHVNRLYSLFSSGKKIDINLYERQSDSTEDDLLDDALRRDALVNTLYFGKNKKGQLVVLEPLKGAYHELITPDEPLKMVLAKSFDFFKKDPKSVLKMIHLKNKLNKHFIVDIKNAIFQTKALLKTQPFQVLANLIIKIMRSSSVKLSIDDVFYFKLLPAMFPNVFIPKDITLIDKMKDYKVQDELEYFCLLTFSGIQHSIHINDILSNYVLSEEERVTYFARLQKGYENISIYLSSQSAPAFLPRYRSKKDEAHVNKRENPAKSLSPLPLNF